MALTVIVRSGDAKTPPAITFDTPRVVIGRGDGCEVCLPDASVSHRHASIRQRGTDYIVVDEGSTNGTFVGPVRLSPQAPRMLRSGELIRVGRIWLEIRIEQAVPTQNSHVATKELALALVAEALAAQGQPSGARVRTVAGPDAESELLLTDFEHPYVIGRGGNADLSVTDDDASRRHADIVRRGHQLLVRDLASKNGTRLADKELEPNKFTVWTPGAELVIGKNHFLHEDPVAEALRELERAADEAMSPDESVDPPQAAPAALPSAADSGGTSETTAEPQRSAPITSVPTRGKRPPPRRRGFSTTDWLVAGLSLVVLAFSLIGLFWLFRLE
jgi:pSer/pThr/pTyr-binding forkhead associated (FHA) protein